MASSLPPNATPANTTLREEQNAIRYASPLSLNATPGSTTLRAEENGIMYASSLAPNANKKLRAEENGVRYASPLSLNATPANTLRAEESGIRYASPLSLKATPENGTQRVEKKDVSRYLPLHKAALKGDWDTAKGFLYADPDAVRAKITSKSETILHVAVGTGRSIQFLQKLLNLEQVTPELLETLTDENGKTVLHSAAQFGNIEAAKMLVERNQRLPNTWSSKSLTPFKFAALIRHRELTLYLLTVTKENVGRNPFAGEDGVSLLNTLIYSELYDIALQVVQHDPKLGTSKSGIFTPLGAIAAKPSAFPSGTQFKLWQWFIYSCVPIKSENIFSKPNVGDSENPCECCTKMGTWVGAHFIHVCQKLRYMIWSIMERIPQIKIIKETKLMHSQTLELVKCLCMEIASLDHPAATESFKFPVLSAAKLGIHEVVEEILESFPDAIWSLDKNEHDMFRHAVINRREKVFNLLYQCSQHSQRVLWFKDKEKNTILHLAGKLAPPHRINLVSGAALQMQRELQWYKEVRKWVLSDYELDSKERTAAVAFTEEHENLVKEGERWMKDTANSCSLAAALIATIAFTAAITVPGGTDGNSGFPVFSKEFAFIVFVVSNAISLFSSTASLLMFLSILTARYAEDDFLFSLPRRLIIGLITLFLSITSMMISFSSTLYLVVGNKSSWALVSVAMSAYLPVTLFVSLQFPLLVDMIRSTYGCGMFGRNIYR